MRALLALLPALLLGAPASARQAVLPQQVRQAAERITASQLMRDVEYLASDALLGRATPSPGLDSAAAFLARRLERAGLQPLGDDGGWFQRYTVREAEADTVGAYLAAGARRFSFGDDFVLPSLGGATSLTAPVVYVGHGFYAPSLGVDPYAGVDVRGRILLVHGPGVLPPGIRSPRVTAEVSPAVWEAYRRGALAVVFIAPPPFLSNWDVFRRQGLTRRELDPMVPSAYAASPVPSVMVRPAVVEALLAGTSVSAVDLVAEGARREFTASVELPTPLTLHLPAARERVHRPPNVVALLEGSDPELRHEYVTVAAHLDGAVGTRAVDGDSIYNSADDNATGSAGILAMAEAFLHAPRPRRSIVFLWDSGEEVGLWGTRWFVHAPPVPLDRIVAHFNIDMIGGTKAPGTDVRGEEELTGPGEVYLIGPRVLSEAVDSLLVQANREFLDMRLNRAYDTPASEFFYPRTDAGPFLERGILTIGFFTGLHPRYHLPSDEAQHVDPEKMEAVARTAFVSVWLLANQRERPGVDRPIPPSVPRHR